MSLRYPLAINPHLCMAKGRGRPRRRRERPNQFDILIGNLVTGDMRAQVMDEADPKKHGDAILQVLEKQMPIHGGMQEWYANPATRLVLDQGTGEISLTRIRPEMLFDKQGELHVFCDQYAMIVRDILLGKLSDRAANAKIRMLLQYRNPEANTPLEEMAVADIRSTHFGTYFYVGEERHVAAGIPRFYKSQEYHGAVEASPKLAIKNAYSLGSYRNYSEAQMGRPFTEFKIEEDWYEIVTLLTHRDEHIGTLAQSVLDTIVRANLIVHSTNGSSWLVEVDVNAANMGPNKHTIDAFMPVSFRNEVTGEIDEVPEAIRAKVASTCCVIFGKQLKKTS